MTDVEDQARRTIRTWADSIEVDVPERPAPSDYVRSAPASQPSRRLRLVAVAAAAVLVVVAGVVALRDMGSSRSVDSTHLEDPSTTITFPTPIGQLGSVSPLFQFTWRGTSGGLTYDEALQQRIGTCMNARGWDYPIADHPSSGGGEPTDPAALVTFRQTYGYGLLNGVPSTRDTGPSARYQEMLDSFDAEQKARFYADLGGSAYDEGGERVRTSSGCWAEAEDEVLARYPQSNPGLLEAATAAQQTITQDARYLEALDGWRACMSEAGFDYQAEDDGRGEVSEIYAAANGAPTEEQRARERAIGAADASCAFGTLWPARAVIEGEIVLELVAEFGEEGTCGERCG